MKILLTLFLIVMTYVLSTDTALSRDEPAKKGKAFLVGVNQYENFPPLRYSVRDVEALRTELEWLSWNVTLLGNATNSGRPTKAKILASLREFAAGVREDDQIMVSYSGSAVEFDGQLYLIPIDASLTLASMIPIQAIFDELRPRRPQSVLAVVDACRYSLEQVEGHLNARIEIGQTLPNTTPSPGTFILYGCERGKPCREMETIQHGALMYALLEGIKDRATSRAGARFTADELAKFAMTEVPRLTNGEQRPKISMFDVEKSVSFSPGLCFVGFDLTQEGLARDKLLRAWKEGRLAGTDFTGSKLAGINLNGANLARAVFTRADLTGTSFRNAKLRSANFSDAIVAGADFSNADIESAVGLHGR